jgi:hypothetical protein
VKKGSTCCNRLCLLILLISIMLVLPTACSKPLVPAVELKYDNNALKEYLPVSNPTFTGYVVEFTSPSDNFTVRRIRISGMVAAWGKYEDKAVEIQIWDKDRKVVSTVSCPDAKFPVNPYDQKTPFHPEDSWTDVDVSPLTVSGQFYVHVHSDDGRWGEFRMGADDTTANSHSDVTVRDGDVDQVLNAWPYWRKDSAGKDLWYGDKAKVNWMIRVVGTNPN